MDRWLLRLPAVPHHILLPRHRRTWRLVTTPSPSPTPTVVPSMYRSPLPIRLRSRQRPPSLTRSVMVAQPVLSSLLQRVDHPPLLPSQHRPISLPATTPLPSPMLTV